MVSSGPSYDSPRLRKRPVILIHREILRAVSTGPLGTTRLARRCNIPLDRFGSYVNLLVVKGYLRKETVEGHDSFRITEEGIKMLDDLESVLVRLTP